MTENKDKIAKIEQNDQKTEQMIEKQDEKTDVISLEKLFEGDITYRDLPDSVKEYFQQYLNRIPKNVAAYKSDIEIIQGLKNIFISAYLRDALFKHIVMVEYKYKDKEDPEEWARQINPSLFTKIEKFIATNRNEVAETFDNAAIDDDYDKFEKVTLTRIQKAQKIIKKKEKPPKEKTIDGEYEVIK